MELPDLAEPVNPAKEKLARVLTGLDELRKGEQFGVGYKIGPKGLDLSKKVGNGSINGSIGFDGDYKISASTPFLGGNLSFNGSKKEDGKKAYLQFNRSF